MLDKATFVGFNLCHGKNDYKTGGLFLSLSLALEVKYVPTIDRYGIIQQHMTSKGFNDSKRLLECSQSFKMLEGVKRTFLLG